MLVALVAVPAAFARHSGVARRTTVRQTTLQTLGLGVLVELNAIRRAHHLVPLKLNPALTAGAHGHSAEMLADGYFAHNSFDGTPFWKRLTAYSNSSHGAWSVGENLLWSSPDVDADGALRLWIASPEHLANLLNPRWRQIGVAAVHMTQAPGVFHGMDVTIVTTDFGVRH